MTSFFSFFSHILVVRTTRAVLVNWNYLSVPLIPPLVSFHWLWSIYSAVADVLSDCFWVLWEHSCPRFAKLVSLVDWVKNFRIDCLFYLPPSTVGLIVDDNGLRWVKHMLPKFLVMMLNDLWMRFRTGLLDQCFVLSHSLFWVPLLSLLHSSHRTCIAFHIWLNVKVNWCSTGEMQRVFVLRRSRAWSENVLVVFSELQFHTEKKIRRLRNGKTVPAFATSHEPSKPFFKW